MRIYHNDELVVDYAPADYCPCGKAYDDNPAGEVFKAKNTVHLQTTVENLKKILQMPELCFYCYYRNELNMGNWAPKIIKELD